jgi:hypothetical protein
LDGPQYDPDDQVSTELDLVSSAVVLPGAKLTRTALIIDEKATDEQLSQIGTALCSIEGSRSWWIGDYACALTKRKGEHYTEGRAEALNIEPNTFRIYKMVAAFFEPLTRLNDLSFWHHREAMGGADDDLAVAQNWLAEAAKNNWSVAELRRAIRTSRAEYKDDGLKPTGNGYSVLLDADRWASSQLKEIGNYTAEQATAILGDIERLVSLLDQLRVLAQGEAQSNCTANV